MKPKFKITAKMLARTEFWMSWIYVVFVSVFIIFFLVYMTHFYDYNDDKQPSVTMEEVFTE